jgi:para-aminobenzoate synthetase
VKGNQTKLSGQSRRVRSLLIDNYDSYTYNLFAQLSVINDCEAIVVRNDVTWEELACLEFDNIVLSPGPGHPAIAGDFGVCAEVLRRAQVPVLGVCLGHQGIAMAYGGQITEAREILHGRSSPIFHTDDDLFAGLPQGFSAVRYHSLVVVPPVPDELRVSAWTSDGTIMGLTAATRPIYGVQFHPESCMTDEGTRILENFRTLTLERMPSQENGRGRAREAATRGRIPDEMKPAKTNRRMRAIIEQLSGVHENAEGVFDALRGRGHAVWLDSARRSGETGRFSYIALAEGPLGHLVRYDRKAHTCTIEANAAAERREETGIFEFLRAAQANWDVEIPHALPFSFCGGYVGWFGYECKADCGIPTVHEAATDDAAFLFADRTIVFDHDAHRVTLIALVGEQGEAAAHRWFAATRRIVEQAQGQAARPLAPAVEGTTWAWPAREHDGYVGDVRRARDRLRIGDSYQVCLTTQFSLESPLEPFEAYRRLRRANPAPYAAFLDFGTTQVACASPERFVRITSSGDVEVKPMKGTAARHAEPRRDAASAQALAADPKERAENLMIVDLLRNDLSRVCWPGSVHVASLMAIESYESVHQMVSTVRGTFREGITSVDAVRACFPGGSMTGAPKVRACSIIDELEPQARGIYSGAIGYFSVGGAAEFNIVIRSVVYHGGHATVGAGGGITILSDADREWDEVLLKAQSVLGPLGARADAGAVRSRRTTEEG